ncbi:DNA helicase [Solibacillus sp. R5-41]|uniref:DNA helicase n=1 Tax=Solibacillus sp. R5-41 TaxID=2048654 RepID=UPI000C129866|nr:DNA helicase [Solibacillus sp. R5-41]ATP41161.1 DNA helicase [Solibacillus sp. R5-41]
MLTDSIQKEITTYIEQQIFLLTKNADVKTFEQVIQQNVNDKRQSAKSTVDFYDRLMLNIAYFEDNKTAWKQMIIETYGAGQVPKISTIESELMAQQMRIRQDVAEKMDDYTKAFHKQYEALNVTDEEVIYDYAYASLQHTLRIDFLTHITVNEAMILTKGNMEETLKMIDGYIAYYADQFVNQMELT